MGALIHMHLFESRRVPTRPGAGPARVLTLDSAQLVEGASIALRWVDRDGNPTDRRWRGRYLAIAGARALVDVEGVGSVWYDLRDNEPSGRDRRTGWWSIDLLDRMRLCRAATSR